jgi:hypothetical protein
MDITSNRTRGRTLSALLIAGALALGLVASDSADAAKRRPSKASVVEVAKKRPPLGGARTFKANYGQTSTLLGCVDPYYSNGAWYSDCRWWHHYPLTPFADGTYIEFYRWNGSRWLVIAKAFCGGGNLNNCTRIG